MTAVADTLLVVNAGSPSIKFQLFDAGPGSRLERRAKGQLEGIGTRPRLAVGAADGATLIDEAYAAADVPDLSAAMRRLGDWLIERLGDKPPRWPVTRGRRRP